VLGFTLLFSVLNLLNFVKLVHCTQLSLVICPCLSICWTHTKKVLSSLENEFILSEFSRRTYMTIPKQNLNSDHRFRCDIFLLHTLSIVHKTNAECEIKSRPSIILNFAERIKKKTGNPPKQTSCKFNCRINEEDYCWPQKRIDSDLTTPRSNIVGVLCRIWPTMKIHADTDSTSSKFSHFFCYTLAHPFYVKK